METKESTIIPKLRKTTAIVMYLIIIGIFAIEMLYIMLTQATSPYMSLYIELSVVAFLICTGVNYFINTVKIEAPQKEEAVFSPKTVEAPTPVIKREVEALTLVVKKEEVKDIVKVETPNAKELPAVVIKEVKDTSSEQNTAKTETPSSAEPHTVVTENKDIVSEQTTIKTETPIVVELPNVEPEITEKIKEENNVKIETQNVIEEPSVIIAESKTEAVTIPENKEEKDTNPDNVVISEKESLDENKNVSEAIAILIKLGYKKRLAKVMVYKAYEIIGNADLAQLVKKSLTLETDST
jgi:hypothetical protein